MKLEGGWWDTRGIRLSSLSCNVTKSPTYKIIFFLKPRPRTILFNQLGRKESSLSTTKICSGHNRMGMWIARPSTNENSNEIKFFLTTKHSSRTAPNDSIESDLSRRYRNTGKQSVSTTTPKVEVVPLSLS